MVCFQMRHKDLEMKMLKRPIVLPEYSFGTLKFLKPILNTKQ